MKIRMWMRALALVLVLALTGCGSPKGEGDIVSNSQQDSANSTASTEEAGNASAESETAESTMTVDAEVNGSTADASDESTLSGETTDSDIEGTSSAVTQEPVDSSSDDAVSPENVLNPEPDTLSEETVSQPVETVSENELDEQQKKSIAMLNYLAVLSQEINSSKNSRMFLEEAYAALINNTNPEGVNELTESHLASLLDIIEKYRMITVKRDRLQYIYEQNKAQALKEAVPNPIGLLSAVSSFDFKRLAASAIYMAVDSYTSYKSYNAELDLQYLQDGWELDDEEAENVHDSRKRAFMFMLDIVREDNLPGKLALNESSVEEYVTWKNNTNTYQKIQFFESQTSTYEAFGDYWLTLASCYYDQADYEKCLECFDKYEELQADIFRKDYNFAKALPQAIVAAKEVYSTEEYVPIAERYLGILVDNTENTEWSLKYFAAQMYLDLYAQTQESRYLDQAYTLALNNVNYLVAKQKELNTTYRSDVKEVELPSDPSKDASKDEKASYKDQKKKIEEYNKALKEKRKVELPPVYEPLVLNCDLLFALADERNITSAEKNKIEGILHQGSSKLFLTEILNNRYSFSPEEIDVEAQFEKDTLTVPAICLSETSYVKVTVTNNGSSTVYEDWQIKKVERKSEDVTSFKVTLTSKECDKQEWSADSTVKVEIFDEKESDKRPYVVNFKVSKYKKIPVLPDTVEFEQVK